MVEKEEHEAFKRKVTKHIQTGRVRAKLLELTSVNIFVYLFT